jgi:mycothione reductase
MEHFDLVVIGSGSGNVVVPEGSDRRVALIEAATFRGTCVNRGCIPTKMFAYTAELAMQVRRGSQFGLRARLDGVDWPAIRDRVAARITDRSRSGRDGRVDSPAVRLFEARARFVGPHDLHVDDDVHIYADQIVIATGGRPSIPAVVDDSGVDFHTSDSVLWLDALPQSMVILGGGYVAVELAHIFSSFGVEIHLVEASDTLLVALDAEIAARFTELALSRWDLHTNASVTTVTQGTQGVTVVLDDGTAVAGEMLVVATGRRPNTDDLGLDRAGVCCSEDGHIVVDEFGRAAPGIWALGDCSSPFELKHVANAEARTLAHNLAHPDDLRPFPHDWVPAAVFSDPQIATVGARSQDLAPGSYVEVMQEYRDVAYGWAMGAPAGFCKVYLDRGTETILGAHVLGEQASLLITPLIQAATHGQPVSELARGQYWIHPALSEVVENALVKLAEQTGPSRPVVDKRRRKK